MLIFSRFLFVSVSFFAAMVLTTPAWAGVFPPEVGHGIGIPIPTLSTITNTSTLALTPTPTSATATTTDVQPPAETSLHGATLQCCGTTGTLNIREVNGLLALLGVGVEGDIVDYGVNCESVESEKW